MNRYKYWRASLYWGIVLVVLAVSLAGCGPQINISVRGPTRVVIDDEGTSVEVPLHPQRIVTFTSAFDTILLDLVESERMVAVSYLTKYKDFSLSWKQARRVSVFLKNYNLETIVELHPDLVIVPDYSSRDVVSSLRGMHIPTVVVSTGSTVPAAERTIVTLANIVNEINQGRVLVDKIHQDLRRVADKRKLISEEKKKTVVFLSSMNGYAGTGSLFNDMCRYMGIINSPEAKSYPPRTMFTDERIVAMNPDYLLIPVFTHKDENIARRFYTDPAFEGMTSVSNKQVISTKAAYLYTMNQYIGESMLRIMQIVYPELFGSSNLVGKGGGLL